MPLRKGRRAQEDPFDIDLQPRKVGVLGESFQPNPYGPPESRGGAPPNTPTGDIAKAMMIAKRALVALRYMRPSEQFEVDPNNPIPDGQGYYALTAWEAREAPCGDGVRRNAIVVKGQPEGYERMGVLGTEALEVSVKSNWAADAGGKTVFSAACPTANVFGDSTKTITQDILFARLRVRNPWLSRIVVKLGNMKGMGDNLEGTGVKIWISKGQPIEQTRVTPIARVRGDMIIAAQRTFNIVFEALPLSIVDESVSACPVPGDDDTYFLCMQTDEGLTVTVTTRNDGGAPAEHWPYFELYTLVGSSTGGASPGGLPVSAVRSQAIVKLFLQKLTVPVGNYMTLADASAATGVALPAPAVVGDTGADATGGAAPGSPLTQDFWHLPPYPFILPRGWMKVKIKFTPAGGNSVTQIDVAILKNTGTGTVVLFTRTFAAIAIGAVTEIAVPVQITGDTTFNLGEFIGIRIKLTHNNVGTLNINHTRGTDEGHAEAAVSA
jgi:hypothetical protein